MVRVERRATAAAARRAATRVHCIGAMGATGLRARLQLCGCEQWKQNVQSVSREIEGMDA